MADHDLDDIVARHFQCTRCRHFGCHVKRIAAPLGAHDRLYAEQQQRYLAVSCERCGLTDFFDLDVLESPHSVPGAFLYKS